MIVRAIECSICHQDADECEHVVGRAYEGQQCHRLLQDVEVFEVSLVARPAQPDARIMAQSVPVADLREALPPEWEPGMAVSCDRCLAPCDGISDPLLEGHQEPFIRRPDRGKR
jgi:hypothetical protein